MKRPALPLLLGALIALSCVTLAQQQPSALQARSYGGVDPAVVMAWEKSGAEFVIDGAVPTFTFDQLPSSDDFSALPTPGVPFAVRVNGAVLTDLHLEALGKFRGLRALALKSCRVANDTSLARLASLEQLQALDLRHLKASDAALNQLAGLKELRSLRLTDVAVSDEGLRWLAGLEHLETLSLQSKGITGAALNYVAKLPRLRELEFPAVGLSASALSALAAQNQLQTLRIGLTHLSDRELATLARMTRLRELDLRATSGYSAAGLGELARLTELESLNLAGAQMEVAESWLRGLASLSHLRKLSLSRLDVRDSDLKMLGTLAKLEVLDLAFTRITDADLVELAALRNLRELQLGGTHVSDPGLAVLAGMSQLQVLGLRNTRITDAGVQRLGALTHLRELALDGEVTDVGVKSLGTLTQLTNLDLVGIAGPITDASVGTLARLPLLQSLSLPLAGISAAGITELIASHPALLINDHPGSTFFGQVALEAARSIADPAARLGELQRLRSETTSLRGIDTVILSTLVNYFPDRTERIAEELNRIIAAIPEGATPSNQLMATVDAVSLLVEKRVLLNRAEHLVSAALAPVNDKQLRAAALAALARIHIAQGDAVKARIAIEEGLALQPNTVSAGTAALTAALAELEVQEDRRASALDHFLTAAAVSALTPTQDASLHALYRQARGTEAGIEDALNRRHRELLPSPVKPARYVPGANRGTRIVLFEMFTGSGCGPCAAADLAFDGLLARYPADAVAAVAYHEHILPDPMVISTTQRQTLRRSVGVPTVFVDGRMTDDGGGPRTVAPESYASYVASIDKRLQVPAAADLSLRATGDGDRITVSATVTGLPGNKEPLRLRILLVERELGYLGENGIRSHAMVVRAMADADGAGHRIQGNGTTTQTFSLSAIRADVEASLATEVASARRYDASRVFAAEGHAQTTIDTSRLVAVAYVQQGGVEGPPNVLQAAQADVVFRPKENRAIETPARASEAPSQRAAAASDRKIPVTWSLALAPDSRPATGGRFAAIVTAKIDADWHVYSMTQPPNGPAALLVGLPGGQPFSLAGPVAESRPTTKLDPTFGVETQFFAEAATLTVPIRVAPGTPPGRRTLQINLDYQICSKSRCLPPAAVELKLDVTIAGGLR